VAQLKRGFGCQFHFEDLFDAIERIAAGGQAWPDCPRYHLGAALLACVTSGPDFQKLAMREFFDWWGTARNTHNHKPTHVGPAAMPGEPPRDEALLAAESAATERNFREAMRGSFGQEAGQGEGREAA
jgi:hypothetical protein